VSPENNIVTIFVISMKINQTWIQTGERIISDTKVYY
jgi:hypothetical protein